MKGGKLAAGLMVFFTLILLFMIFSKTVQHKNGMAGKETGVFASVPQAQNANEKTSIGNCVEGSTKDCEDEECAGTSTCIRGEWRQCVKLPRECREGERVPCSSNACEFGWRYCDGCGRLGECINK